MSNSTRSAADLAQRLGERELRARRIRQAHQLAKVGLHQRVSATRQTFQDLAVEHMAWCERRIAGRQMKPSTLAVIRTRYRSTILPALAGVDLSTWTVDDAERWHATATQANGPIAANRAAEVLRAAWMLAERWGWVPPASSPFRYFRTFRNLEEARHVVLSPSQLDSAHRHLRAWEEDDSKLWTQRLAAQAIQLILATGARKEEVFGLEWSEVCLDPAPPRLIVQRHKTSRRRGAKRIALSDEAVAILRRVPRARGESLVFPHANYRSVWHPIREAIGARDVTLHDLRRTFSSRAHQAGIPVEHIAAMLGQTTIRVNTERYMNLDPDYLHELANRGARAVQGAS